MAVPDRASEIRQLGIDIGEAETQALALNLRDLVKAQAALDTVLGEVQQGEASAWDKAGTVTEYDPPSAEQKADKKARADAAKREVDRVNNEIKRLTKTATTAKARRNQLVDQERTAQGDPLTAEERQALGDDLRKSQADADRAEWESANSQLDYEIALAKASGQPVDALQKRKDEAQIARDEAAVVSAQLDDRIAAQKAGVDALLAPFTVREAEAGAISAESQATRDEALAAHAEQLAQAEADIQSGNADWQEIQNRIALMEEETTRQLLDAGMPQIEIDSALADLKSKDIANQQTDEGAKATAIKQIKEAIKRGDMDPVAATDLYYEQIGYGTPLERRQEGRANAMALNQTAISAGLYGPPGGLDAGGNLSKALQGVGVDYTPTPGPQMQLPQWAQSLGVDISAQQGVPTQPVFDEQGEMLPRAAFAQSLMPPPSVNMTPDELTAWVAGRKGEQPAPVSPTQAQAAVATPDAAQTPSAGKAITITEPDGRKIEIAGGEQPVTQPPASIREDTGADDWWAGVTANPVLSAAAKYGEMSNAEAFGDVSKVSYKDGSVRWFDPQGSETTEPRMAEAPAAAPAPAVVPAADPAVAPVAVPPAVGPKTNPGPPADANPEPWGMKKFGPQPSPATMPRFARSLMFAGGR